MSFDSVLKRTQTFLNRNTPAILTGLSVAGVVTGVVLAVKATPEAHREIVDAESERTEPLTPVEKVRLVWRHYLPAGVVVVMTVGTIITAQSVNHRRQAALMSVFTLTETGFREYREKVVEELGEKKEAAIRDKVAVERLERNPRDEATVIIAGSGNTAFFDSISGRHFTNDLETVRQAVNDINEQCLNHMNASLNEFYDKIGLEGVRIGEEQGWRLDHLLKMSYPTALHDGIPVIVLDYENLPIPGFYHINP